MGDQDLDLFPKYDWESVAKVLDLDGLIRWGSKAIKLEGNVIGSSYEAVLEILKGDEIVALKFSQNNLSTDGFTALMNMLLYKYNMEYFGVERNSLDLLAFQSCANMLRVNQTLISLSISDCGLDDEHIGYIAKQLEYNNRSLLQLDLSNNNIGDKGAHSIADALCSNYILTTVCLQNNLIGEDGGNALLNALEKGGNYALTRLELDGNNIGDVKTKIEVEIGKNYRLQRDSFKYASDFAMEAPWRSFRLNVVGQHRSGKSCLVKRLLNEAFDRDYTPSVGVVNKPVQARIDGSPWRKHGYRPLNGYCADFLGRFATIRLDNVLNQRDKEIVEEKNTRTNRMSLILTKSANMKDKAKQSQKSKERRMSAEPRAPRRSVRDSMISTVTSIFKRNRNFKFDETAFCFYNDNQYDPSNAVYEEDEMDSQFHPVVLAKARRERDNMGFNIYEFSGQRIYYCLYHSFLVESGVYILTFNMVKLLSSDRKVELECIRYLNYWLKTIKYNSPGAYVALVGTHLDKVKLAVKQRYQETGDRIPVETYITECQAKLDERLAVIYSELDEKNDAQAELQAKRLAAALVGDSLTRINLVKNTNKLRFFPVSLYDGQGLVHLRKKIDELAERQRYFNEPVPPHYLKFYDVMMEDSKNKKWISEAMYRKSAENVFGEHADIEIPRCLKFLENAGKIVNMKHLKKGLKDAVVLDPNWLYESTTKIFMSGADPDKERFGIKIEDYIDITKKSVISSTAMKQLWGSDESITFLTKFLETNLIISRWPHGESKQSTEKKYVIPSLVKIPPPSKEFVEENSNLIAVFDFKEKLTLGVYERLVCQVLQTTIHTNPNSKEPDLFYDFSRHHWEGEFELTLTRKPNIITCIIAEYHVPPIKCVKRILKMLQKVESMLGEGIEYETNLQVSTSGQRDFQPMETVTKDNALWYKV